MVGGYTHQYGGDYKQVAKEYRKSISAKKLGNPSLWGNGEELEQYIGESSRMRVSSNMRNVIWRVITDKLFAGGAAAVFIRSTHGWHPHAKFSQETIATSLNKCWLCDEQAPSTSHILWECGAQCMQTYWAEVHLLWQGLGLGYVGRPNLCSSLAPQSSQDIGATMKQDFLWTAIYQVWVLYNKTLEKVKPLIESQPNVALVIAVNKIRED